MSYGAARVEVSEFKKNPNPPSPFEVDIAGIAISIGSLPRNQMYRRFGLVGLVVPTTDSNYSTRVEVLWVPEVMKYSEPALQPHTMDRGDRFLRMTPLRSEGVPQSLSPFLMRIDVGDYHTGGVQVSKEGFVFSERDLLAPSGVDRPLGKTLKRAMDSGECTDLLVGRTYVFVGEEHAGKNLFRVALQCHSGQYYRDAAIIGPKQEPNGLNDVYKDGSPINALYPRRIIQIKRP